MRTSTTFTFISRRVCSSWKLSFDPSLVITSKLLFGVVCGAGFRLFVASHLTAILSVLVSLRAR
jgi:hypothetical protein